MTKLIILGGGNCQMNAFLRAKERGISTVLFDMYASAPAAQLADEYYPASTFDLDACLDAARLAQADGVMTLGTDQPVYTAARIADELGLPSFISSDTALDVTNKAAMKRRLLEAGIPTARYWLADGSGLGAVEYDGPLVIKPIDNQGQKGVFRCDGIHEAESLLGQSLAFSRSEQVLIEQYYPSREMAVSAWVHDGETHVLTVTDRYTYDDRQHIGVCAAHRFPSQWAEGCDIDGLVQQVAEACRITAGPLYIQLLRGREGVIVNELACRIGGAFEDVFIPYLTGFDILDAVINGALGGEVAPPQPFDAGSRQARVLMPCAKGGRLHRMTPIEEIRALPSVENAAYNRAEGDSLPPFENSGARLGHAVLLAEDEGQMQHSLEAFWSAFYALDERGESILMDMPAP